MPTIALHSWTNHAQIEAHITVSGGLGGVVLGVEAVLYAAERHVGVRGDGGEAGGDAAGRLEYDGLPAEVHQAGDILEGGGRGGGASNLHYAFCPGRVVMGGRLEVEGPI